MALRGLPGVLVLPVLALALGWGGAAMAQATGQGGGADQGGCRPSVAGPVDRSGKNPQPTQAQILERLDQSGCGDTSVDASQETAKQVDELYDQLMKATDADQPPAGQGQGK